MTTILAVDPGSHIAAAVVLVGDRIKLAIQVEGSPKDNWQSRLHSMAADLTRELSLRDYTPDLIAIEKVVAHRNLNVAVTMAMTVGYLVRTLDTLYPEAQWLEVGKADVCRTVGVKGNARRAERQKAARAMWPKMTTQDLADAAAVGYSALAALKVFS